MRLAGKGQPPTGTFEDGLRATTLAPGAVWDPPKLAEYPEGTFKPLFHGRTIDGPLPGMPNCWLEERFGDYAYRFDYRLRSPEAAVVGRPAPGPPPQPGPERGDERRPPPRPVAHGPEEAPRSRRDSTIIIGW